MSNVYSEFKNISKSSIPQRIKNFREATLELLHQNKCTIEELEVEIKNFEELEMYEASEGVRKAINDYNSGKLF